MGRNRYGWIRKDEVTKIKYEIKELLNNVKMENEE